MQRIDSTDLVIAKRLLDYAKQGGFRSNAPRLERMVPGGVPSQRQLRRLGSY